MSVNVMTSGRCGGTFQLGMPGFPASLIGVYGGESPAILDLPDEVPDEGESAILLGFAGPAMLDYRGRDRDKSGRYGLYFELPEGEIKCGACGYIVANPPKFPFFRCQKRRSGMHDFTHIPTPPVMETDWKG